MFRGGREKMPLKVGRTRLGGGGGLRVELEAERLILEEVRGSAGREGEMFGEEGAVVEGVRALLDFFPRMLAGGEGMGRVEVEIEGGTTSDDEDGGAGDGAASSSISMTSIPSVRSAGALENVGGGRALEAM